MKILIQLAMAAMLAAYARELVKTSPGHPSSDHAQRVTDANNRLTFSRAAGIDAFGGRVNLSGGARVVAFVVRGQRLSDDLEFWRDVHRLLSKGSLVEMVAYCDSGTCVEQLRKEKPRTEFPVIAFGEMIDAQALLNADAAGFFLFKRAKLSEKTRPIQWREKGQTPSTVVRSILS